MSQIYISDVAASIPFDNTTNTWVANNVQTAIEEAPIHLRALEVSATANYNLPLTATIITGMTITPPAGTYLVWFSTDCSATVAGQVVTIYLAIAGTQVAQSVRIGIPEPGGLLSGNGRIIFSTNGLLTVNGSQTITVVGMASANGPVMAARTLNLLRTL